MILDTYAKPATEQDSSKMHKADGGTAPDATAQELHTQQAKDTNNANHD